MSEDEDISIQLRELFEEIIHRFPQSYNANYIKSYLSVNELPEPIVILSDLEFISFGNYFNNQYTDEKSKADAQKYIDKLNGLVKNIKNS